MARLIIDGDKKALKGLMGQCVARTFNGKTYLYARPTHYTLSNSPAAVNARQRFQVTVKLSKSIASLPVLAEIWKSVQLKGRTIFHTIFKYNIHHSSISQPTVENIITPFGFRLPVDTASVDAYKITASLSALNATAIFNPEEVNLSVNAVICYIDPISNEDESYQLITCSKEIEGFDFNQSYEIKIDFTLKEKYIALKYNKCILYLCAATKTIDGKLVRHSASYSSLVMCQC